MGEVASRDRLLLGERHTFHRIGNRRRPGTTCAEREGDNGHRDQCSDHAT
jgi:hypothetical protein